MKAKVVLGTSVVVADVVSENEKSVRVMLPNGAIVKRKKDRDVLAWIDDVDEIIEKHHGAWEKLSDA